MVDMTTFHTIGSTVPLVVTVTLSLVGGVTLPSTTRIRWTIGEYAHLGPEVVRTDLFLVTVPAVTLLGVLVSRPLIARMSDRGAAAICAGAVLASLGMVVGVQALVIALNVL